MTAVIHTCSTRPATKSNAAVRFHLSLNVASLEKSIAFFRAFFGVEPAKCRPDYAKFETDDPPLVLSLEPYAAQPGGNLNHLGFRMPDSAALVEVQRRLEVAGISTRREEGVECCYARQTKFWVHDPDGNMWEVYTLDEDLERRGDGHLPVLPAAEKADDAPKSVWSHRLGDRFPQRLPILDGSVDLANLQGTLNERLTSEETARRLAEVHRVLRSGAKVQLHVLTSDRPLGDQPIKLPGPAAPVQAVPEEATVLAALRTAGFVDVRTSFRGQNACFMLGECELRETRLEGTR